MLIGLESRHGLSVLAALWSVIAAFVARSPFEFCAAVAAAHVAIYLWVSVAYVDKSEPGQPPVESVAPESSPMTLWSCSAEYDAPDRWGTKHRYYAACLVWHPYDWYGDAALDMRKPIQDVIIATAGNRMHVPAGTPVKCAPVPPPHADRQTWSLCNLELL